MSLVCLPFAFCCWKYLAYSSIFLLGTNEIDAMYVGVNKFHQIHERQVMDVTTVHTSHSLNDTYFPLVSSPFVSFVTHKGRQHILQTMEFVQKSRRDGKTFIELTCVGSVNNFEMAISVVSKATLLLYLHTILTYL